MITWQSRHSFLSGLSLETQPYKILPLIRDDKLSETHFKRY